MQVLIIKLNATGDVVRTTALLHHLGDSITWITEGRNHSLLTGLPIPVRAIPWEARSQAADRVYDLLLNLEDETDTAAFARTVAAKQIFGAYLDGGSVRYTKDACGWFDMSLISTLGRQAADALKLSNRRSYQEIVFEGLGITFSGERYVLPEPQPSNLIGDVAIAPFAGPVWPMKGWAYYDDLRTALRARGLIVNNLPNRSSLLEHFGDIVNHRCLVSGDSLPMHLALGAGLRCVTIFNCTSPWEIYDYGIQTKIVSPLLADFFYQRRADESAMRAISCDRVLSAVLDVFEGRSLPQR